MVRAGGKGATAVGCRSEQRQQPVSHPRPEQWTRPGSPAVRTRRELSYSSKFEQPALVPHSVQKVPGETVAWHLTHVECAATATGTGLALVPHPVQNMPGDTAAWHLKQLLAPAV